MAIIGNLVIGMAAKTLDLVDDLKKSSAAVEKFAADTIKASGAVRGMSAMNKGLLVGLGALGGLAVAAKGITSAAKASSDLNEQVSKAGTVFGDSAGIVMRGAQEMGDAFGYPKAQFIDGASSIGLIAKASGLAQPAAASMGASFSKLAADAASFYNVPLEEALGAIRSGLVGEAEPMRRFGVLLSQAAVDAEALRMGFTKVAGAFSEGAKVQARAALISRGLADAQGDLERTSGSAANQVRSLWGRLENLGADVGTAMQPATDAVLILANSALKVLAEEINASKDAITNWATGSAGATGSILSGFESIGKGIGMIADVWDAFTIAWKAWVAYSKDQIAGIAGMFVDLAKAVMKAAAHFTTDDPKIAQGEMAAMDKWVERLQSGAAKAKDALHEAIERPPPSHGIEDFFNNTRKAANDAAAAITKAGQATKGMAAPVSDVNEKVMKMIQHFQEENEAIGKTPPVIATYKAALAGASEEQLKMVAGLATQHDRLEKAKKTFDDTRTPLEVYQKRLKELDDLLNSGSINKDTYDRAKRQAKGEYEEKAMPTSRFSSAMERGSQEARTTLLNFAASGANTDDPGKETAKNTAIQAQQGARTNDLLTQLVGRGFNAAMQAVGEIPALLNFQ